MAKFPHDFPFYFDVVPTYKRPYAIEVRDARGNLLRFIGSLISGEITEELNTPAELRLSVGAEDAAAGVLCHGNEIWLRDQEDTLLGKYRIAERDDNNEGTPIIEVRALDYLAQLAEEYIISYNATSDNNLVKVTNIITDLLARQRAISPLTLDILPGAIDELERTIEITKPTTLLQALLDFQLGIDLDTRIYVDTDRVLHWDILDTARTGKLLRHGKDLQTIKRSVRYDQMVTRLYCYGSAATGAHVTPGTEDAGQRWNCYVSGATGLVIILTNDAGEFFDNPTALVGYEAEPTAICVGDLCNDTEIISVDFGETTTTITLACDPPATITPFSTVVISRPFIDSPLRGVIIAKLLEIDHTAVGPYGDANYVVSVIEGDADFAAYGLIYPTADLVFFSADMATELTATINAWVPATGSIDADVTVPEIPATDNAFIYVAVRIDI
ncbi:MAG: hypothetical protein WC551_11975 [Patescibacteria group bacterium]